MRITPDATDEGDIPVIVIPVEKWRRLVENIQHVCHEDVQAELGDDGMYYDSHDHAMSQIDAIIAEVDHE